MPSHVRIIPRRLREWFASSPPMTRREFYAVFSLLFLLVTIALIGVGDQVKRNRERDRAIQTSRLASCRTTYGSIEDVALFFFPTPKERDARQRRIADDLHDFIGKRVDRCIEQVRTATKGAR